MIYYLSKGHDYSYDIMSLTQAFFQNKRYKQVEKINNEGLTIVSILDDCVKSFIYLDNNLLLEDISLDKSKDGIKKSLYKVLAEYTKREQEWGILTGIRPGKILRNLKENSCSDFEIRKHLKDKLIGKSKIDLLFEVYEKQKKYINYDKDSYSLYIGIPFCPSKCKYCSFSSYLIDENHENSTKYLEALFKEIDWACDFLNEKKLETIYIGGGTPTSINEYELENLLSYIKEKFKGYKEFTLEAGRVDSLNRKKLEIIKKYNIDRLSINPQTMNDKTLKIMNRKHSSNDLKEIYYLARDLGFNNINMDLILGFENENIEDVLYSINEILSLDPEEITVHCLSIKTASDLKDKNLNYNINEFKQIYDISHEGIRTFGYSPYYLYRQKNTLANLENIGYSKKGFECIYNIEMIEEKQSIIALGADSSSKLVNNKKIKRQFNPRDYKTYINDIDKIIAKKIKLYESRE